MSVLVGAVERIGWRGVETAALVWAGRMRRDEAGCPPLVAAWRRAVAEVVMVAVAQRGVEGLYELAARTVHHVEAPAPRADALDDAVARWSVLVAALDAQSGARSAFPLEVLAERDLAGIATVADELAALRGRVAA